MTSASMYVSNTPPMGQDLPRPGWEVCADLSDLEGSSVTKVACMLPRRGSYLTIFSPIIGTFLLCDVRVFGQIGGNIDWLGYSILFIKTYLPTCCPLEIGINWLGFNLAYILLQWWTSEILLTCKISEISTWYHSQSPTLYNKSKLKYWHRTWWMEGCLYHPSL